MLEGNYITLQSQLESTMSFKSKIKTILHFLVNKPLCVSSFDTIASSFVHF